MRRCFCLDAPEVIYSELVVKAIVGRDSEIPCSAVGNPAVTYAWKSMSHGVVQTNDKYYLSTNGSLLIRNVQISDEQNYTCAPYNKIGFGQAVDTYLAILGEHCQRSSDVFNLFVRHSFLLAFAVALHSRLGFDVFLPWLCF